MSDLAKVFVVLNLVLAICFLATSATLFTTRDNWRDMAKEVSDRYAEDAKAWKEHDQSLRGKIDTLEGNNQTLESLKEQLVSSNNDLKNEIGELNTSLTELKAKIEQREREIAKRDDWLAEKDQEIARLSQRSEKLTADFQSAREEKDLAVAQRARALLDRQELAKQLSELSKDRAEIKSRLDEVERLLTVAQASGIDLSRIMVPPPPPPIDGNIVAVRPDVELVVLSIGADDGVEHGQEFTVYSGEHFKGKVRIEHVTADMAAARVLFLDSGSHIEVGDKATTRLN